MLRLLRLFFGSLLRLVYSRSDLLLENLALRQQLAVLKSRNPKPRLTAPDRLFWLAARRLWSGWNRSLLLVNPETVVRWHRAGFRLYWTWRSRNRGRVGRKRTSKELRQIIFQMVDLAA